MIKTIGRRTSRPRGLLLSGAAVLCFAPMGAAQAAGVIKLGDDDSYVSVGLGLRASVT